MTGFVVLLFVVMLPLELDCWWTLQSIAFGVVLFTLLVQAPTLPLLLNKNPSASD